MKTRTKAVQKSMNKQKAIEKMMEKYGLLRGDAEFWLDNGVPVQARLDPAYNTLKLGKRKAHKLSTNDVFNRAVQKKEEEDKNKKERQKRRADKLKQKWNKKETT